MALKNYSVFERIFSDALVIDIDFSLWDESVSMLVVADHFKASGPASLVLSFCRVRRFCSRFNHYEVDFDDGHFQWRIDEIQPLAPVNGGAHSFRFVDRDTMPVTEIEFDDVLIREVEHTFLDRVTPGWAEPGGPLVRRGWLQMLREESP
ncbi:MAG: hypothetical protein AAF219_09715 [Myxococcota bacterium]